MAPSLLLQSRLAAAALALVALSALGGCSKKIGDPCTISADCGVTSNRQCDTAQLGGYCTQIGCTADNCPSEAACFLFKARLSGCSYDDREAARQSQASCMKSCDEDGECRPGYVCADVTEEPWQAVLLDTKEIKPKACIVPASFREGGTTDTAEPAICSPVGPQADAGGEPDLTTDPEDDAGTDDAGPDATP